MMRSAPCSLAMRAICRSHSGEATFSPPSPWTVSTTMAAGASIPLEGSLRRCPRRSEGAPGAPCTPVNGGEEEQRALFLGDAGELPQPFRRGHVQPGFALHRFEEEGGGRVGPAGWVV